LKSFLHILLLFLNFSVLAQNNIKNRPHTPSRNCHSTQYNDRLRDKFHLENEDDFEKEISSLISKRKVSRIGTDTITIPVIVHVVHRNEAVGVGANISAAQVYSQIDVLNEDFNKRQNTLGFNNSTVGGTLLVKFVTAKVKPNGDILTEPGIDRINFSSFSLNEQTIETVLKPSTIYDPNRYLNIWTVRFGGDLDGTLGYAQFPSLSKLAGLNSNEGAANTDGVVIGFEYFGRVGNVVSPFNLGRTTTHEIGHFLGLRHIWGDRGLCRGTDYCNDTPQTSDPFYGCPSNPRSCIAGQRAMVENYMDYTNDACMNIFTNDQVQRMNTVLTNSPRRKELLRSDVHLLLDKPIANFESDIQIGCPGTGIFFKDLSANTPTSWRWSIFKNNTLVHTSTSQNFNFLFNDFGEYSIKLIVQNSFGSDTLVKQNYIQISTSATLDLPFFDDFEGNSWLEGWTYANPDFDSTYWYVIESEDEFGDNQGFATMFIDNYGDSVELSGREDYIISPVINFDNIPSTAFLSFDVAYSPYFDGYKLWSDTLVILYSTACGSNMIELWRKGGRQLQTTSAQETTFFEPLSNQWRKERISLAQLTNKGAVNIIIKNISGWGNALYLDNFRLEVPTLTGIPIADLSLVVKTICGGQFTSLSDQSTNFPSQWLWQISSKENPSVVMMANTQNVDVFLTATGVYNVTLTATNSLGSSIPVVRANAIKVLDNPSLTITSSDLDNTICQESITLTGIGAHEYYWFSPRSVSFISDEPNFITNINDTTVFKLVAYKNNGIARCKSELNYTVNYFCQQDSLLSDTLTNFIERDDILKISISPNPTDGNLNIVLKDKNELPLQIKLYNALGVLLFQYNLQKQEEKINVYNLEKGLYLLKINTSLFKILKE
jgi:PKD repeat protein